jgi:transmembrane sensor
MNPSRHGPSGVDRSATIAAAAAEWVMRHDRGLSPAEQDDYLQWVSADPRHAAAMAQQRLTWEAFDRLAGLQASVEAVPDPDLLQPKGPGAARGWARLWFAAPIAAAAALAFVVWPRPAPSPSSPLPALAAIGETLTSIEERTLADGTTIRLNRGAVIAVDYSPGERRVLLERGEAAFAVAKDAARPFVVVAGGVAVRAVGTAFNIRFDATAVDVVVTEGKVSVAPSEVPPPTAHRPPMTDPHPPSSVTLVAAGQRVVVPLDGGAEPPRVSTPPPEEVARRLAWQPRLLTFSDEPLAVILNEFNRHNPVTLRLDDPVLQELRLSARFRSDNVAGFLRLLEAEFGIRAAAQGPGEILLRAAR